MLEARRSITKESGGEAKGGAARAHAIAHRPDLLAGGGAPLHVDIAHPPTTGNVTPACKNALVWPVALVTLRLILEPSCAPHGTLNVPPSDRTRLDVNTRHPLSSKLPALALSKALRASGKEAVTV